MVAMDGPVISGSTTARRSGWTELLPLDRFNAFSDGVFAIAITLLALELTVPVASERLLSALVEQWPEFLGYFISFAFIGGMWLTHARMTRLMKSGDAAVFGINLLCCCSSACCRSRRA